LALSEFEPQSFDLFSKYQNQIKNLENENEILKKKISDYENKFNNNEIEKLKIKIKKIQIEKEKIDENYSVLQKQNKDLNLQISNLKKNEKKYLNIEETINILNNQILNLNNIMIQKFSKTNDELKTKMQE
jgi:DNA repair exonuclease SbcCD ATPase subunit